MPHPTKTEPASATLEQMSLAELFEKELCIPDYQRCYAWASAHVTDLVIDLAKRNGSYLLGTIILHEQKNGKALDVVDGQQRLVTLTILMNEVLPSANMPLLKKEFYKSSMGAIKEAQKNYQKIVSIA